VASFSLHLPIELRKTIMRIPLTLLALPLLFAAPTTAHAQVSPEQRVERLERQVRQLQGRVFPGGQPANTAGVLNDPAASQVVVTALSNRLDNLERQIMDIARRADESATRTAALEAELARLRADNDGRLRALETSRAAAPTTSVALSNPARMTPSASALPAATGNVEADGEAAYDVGYQLWTQKKYDEAITALRAMASAFPGHRRVSWANNLAGRALLDKGEARAAAEALLSNYRANPRGERASDSLFYLGQALTSLKQNTQACKAYAELEAVYGTTMRADLKAQLPGAKGKAGCR
jgi:TolA-binding protein